MRHYIYHKIAMCKKLENTVSILFIPPFWVALFEQVTNAQYSVARLVIGPSEPTPKELYVFLLQLDRKLLQYTTPEQSTGSPKKSVNFKRMQRQIKKATTDCQHKYTYSKAHEALKIQQEQKKQEKKSNAKRKREYNKERKFELKQQKKKMKLKGK